MVDARSGAMECQEEGCVELLAATPEEATQLGMPKSRILQQPPWRRSAIAVAVSAAAALLLVGAAAVARGEVHPSPTAPREPDAVALYSEPYVDPRGQTVCPASMTSKGACTCDCAWAKAIGACAQRRDDSTCCYSCCCPSGGETGYPNEQGGDAYQGGSYHADVDPSTHVAVHVTHHYDHYRAVTQTHHYDHYHVVNEGSAQAYREGEHVYVRASDGRTWAAVIVAANMDGTYRVHYLADRDHGHSVLVSASHITRQQGGLGTPQLWWLIFGAIVVVLSGLACYLYKSTPR